MTAKKLFFSRRAAVELQVLSALSPWMFTDLRAEVLRQVFASDASEGASSRRKSSSRRDRLSDYGNTQKRKAATLSFCRPPKAISMSSGSPRIPKTMIHSTLTLPLPQVLHGSWPNTLSSWRSAEAPEA